MIEHKQIFVMHVEATIQPGSMRDHGIDGMKKGKEVEGGGTGDGHPVIVASGRAITHESSISHAEP